KMRAFEKHCPFHTQTPQPLSIPQLTTHTKPPKPNHLHKKSKFPAFTRIRPKTHLQPQKSSAFIRVHRRLPPVAPRRFAPSPSLTPPCKHPPNPIQYRAQN